MQPAFSLARPQVMLRRLTALRPSDTAYLYRGRKTSLTCRGRQTSLPIHWAGKLVYLAGAGRARKASPAMGRPTRRYGALSLSESLPRAERRTLAASHETIRGRRDPKPQGQKGLTARKAHTGQAGPELIDELLILQHKRLTAGRARNASPAAAEARSQQRGEGGAKPRRRRRRLRERGGRRWERKAAARAWPQRPRAAVMGRRRGGGGGGVSARPRVPGPGGGGYDVKASSAGGLQSAVSESTTAAAAGRRQGQRGGKRRRGEDGRRR